MLLIVSQVPVAIVDTTNPASLRSRRCTGETPRNPVLTSRCGSAGSVRAVTVVLVRSASRCPSRTTPMVAAPFSLPPIAELSAVQSLIGRPLNETTRSPGRSPAFLAGDAGSPGRQARGAVESALLTATTHCETLRRVVV